MTDVQLPLQPPKLLCLLEWMLWLLLCLGLERCGVYLRAATIQGWHLLTLVSIPTLSAYDTLVR